VAEELAGKGKTGTGDIEEQESVMLVARPLQVFRIKGRQIVTCEVLWNNPHEFLNEEVWFYSPEHSPKRIRIEGLSTASDPESKVYDFHYSGMAIIEEEITEHSVITNASFKQAMERIRPMTKVKSG
jgi:hypothetical protein